MHVVTRAPNYYVPQRHQPNLFLGKKRIVDVALKNKLYTISIQNEEWTREKRWLRKKKKKKNYFDIKSIWYKKKVLLGYHSLENQTAEGPKISKDSGQWKEQWNL